MPVSSVPADQLRWSCPAEALDFETTETLRTTPGIVGQESATAALRFGIRIHAPGHNVFVRGRAGTGRRTLVLQVLEREEPTSPVPADLAFVHDFADPNRPRLLSLPPGDAKRLCLRADELVRFVLEDLHQHVNTDSLRLQIRRIEAESGSRMSAVSEPFEAALQAAGLALVGTGSEGNAQPAIVPVVEGKPVPFDAIEDPSQADALRAKADEMMQSFQGVSASIVTIRKENQKAVRALVETHARDVVAEHLADVLERFPAAAPWVDELVTHIPDHMGHLESAPMLVERYRVRVLRTVPADHPRPVVEEHAPTVQRLLGGIDLAQEGPAAAAPHLGIHAGALVEATGGTLVLDAQELLSAPGAWPALKRSLRARSIELTPEEAGASILRRQHLRPESIPIEVKVVLTGEPAVWAALDQQDPDFAQLFKVLVDLDDVVDRDLAGVQKYCKVVARVSEREGLLPFAAGAVGTLVEHGSRVAAQAGKLTARFGRINDLAREAAFLAQARGGDCVLSDDVVAAITDGKQRADLPGRRYRERIASGKIHMQTSGTQVGQVNGLAVVRAGPLSYGFPMRITASVGAGVDGTTHLQREAALSGQIHTKGFLTVQGLLRNFLAVSHPLVFDASITHEQSYGGVDGDSASGAEFVCLVSAITGLPAQQGLAMTGAVDQLGNVLPVGAVDEKIEGFYDTCCLAGLDDAQGVVVPAVGIGDLQLRRDVVEACRDGRFAVYAVDRIEEALELFLGEPPAEIKTRGVARAVALWRASSQGPTA